MRLCAACNANRCGDFLTSRFTGVWEETCVSLPGVPAHSLICGTYSKILARVGRSVPGTNPDSTFKISNTNAQKPIR